MKKFSEWLQVRQYSVNEASRMNTQWMKPYVDNFLSTIQKFIGQPISSDDGIGLGNINVGHVETTRRELERLLSGFDLDQMSGRDIENIVYQAREQTIIIWKKLAPQETATMIKAIDHFKKQLDGLNQGQFGRTPQPGGTLRNIQQQQQQQQEF